MPFSGHFAPRSFTDTLLLPFIRVSRFPGARSAAGSYSTAPGLFVQPVIPFFRCSYKETSGSPKFPDYPFEYMPRSKTPVVSQSLAISLLRLLSSAACKASTFTRHIGIILLSTTIHISGLNLAACILDPHSFVLPLPGLHVWFTTAL